MGGKEFPPAYSTVELKNTPELNILLLGETGVGKSTFINAFANYLRSSSLDDAMQQPDLQCLIPSTFTWPSLVGDEYVTRDIRVLPNTGVHRSEQSIRDERHGTRGQSATQYTKVYSIDAGDTIVRLIDTPGIGDTRGPLQDKANISDILNGLRPFTDLHGILILMKPNEARLNVIIRFCLKELLTNLNSDAAKNVAFGFTNSRNISFRPGETYSTLKSMLESGLSVDIRLNHQTAYFYDSESFRCLAAHFEGVNINDMGDLDQFRNSWNRSAGEARRLLEHFQPSVTSPHQVEKTRSLYRTRELIRVLTVPMAEITQTINSNIALQKDQQRDLQDATLRGEGLNRALVIKTIGHEMKKLERPRTVCSDAKCFEIKGNKIHYPKPCHNPCYLKNIEVDRVQCEALKSCYAFSDGKGGKNETCNACSHSWGLHRHVLQEVVETMVDKEDDAVKARIKENADDVEIIQTAIRTREKLIKEYENERAVIQRSGGQFSFYLKSSSILPFNDSKIEYLDHLISEERAKVEVGGSPLRLNDLLADRKQHEEELRILTGYALAGEDEKLLDEKRVPNMLNELFTLEHTGPNLLHTARMMRDIQESTRDNQRDFNHPPSAEGSSSPEHSRRSSRFSLSTIFNRRRSSHHFANPSKIWGSASENPLLYF